MLYSTGLVAGGSIAGVLIAALSATFVGERNLLEVVSFGRGIAFLQEGLQADILALLMFGLLGFLLFRTAQRKIGGLE
jgi:hypothetical protein